MKKLLLLALLILTASPAFAEIGVNVNGTTIGTATNAYVACNVGATPFINGSDYSMTCSNSLVADGTYNGGYVSLGTIDSGITLTAALVKKNINGTNGTATDVLANGIPNQILILETVGTTTGTWTVSAKGGQSTGWSSIQFNASGQFATLLYVNTTIGWIVVSADGSASTAAPTINDIGGA